MYNLIALALIDCIFFITYNSKLKSKLKKKSKENMLKKEFEKDSGKGCDGAQRKRKKNFEFFLVKKQTSLPKTAEIAKSHLYLLQVTVVTLSHETHTPEEVEMRSAPPLAVAGPSSSEAGPSALGPGTPVAVAINRGEPTTPQINCQILKLHCRR